MTNSIQTTEGDSARFLVALETICAQQATICKQLDELTLLMQLPSESVLRVLQSLVRPMARDLGGLSEQLKDQLAEE